MKKILLLIILANFVVYCQNGTVGAETTNSKQIEMEKERSIELSNTFEKDKSLPYKLLMREDYVTTYLLKNNNVRSIGNEIQILVDQYKSEPNSIEYIYSLKALNLYTSICNTVNPENKDFDIDLRKEKIIISDAMLEKLPQKLSNIIMDLNVMVDKILQ